MAGTLNVGRVVGSRIYVVNGVNKEDIENYVTVNLINVLEGDLFITQDSDVSMWVATYKSGSLDYIKSISLKGDTGEGFSISKTYSSIAAMNAGFSTDGLPEGSFVIIETGNVDDPDNAKLYVKGPSSYQFLTDLSGAQGIRGEQGPQGLKGDTGAKGDTWKPSINPETGVISWTKDNSSTAPSAVSVKGPKGDDGATPSFSINTKGELIVSYS